MRSKNCISLATILSTLLLAANCGGGAGTPPPPSLEIATTSMPDGTIGSFYGRTVQATGGVAPFSWALTSGALPHGLALGTSSNNSVTISGTPDRVQASVAFTMQVKDSKGQSASQPYTVTIQSTPTIVVTQSGAVQGVLEGGLLVFRGIPYAAPPVGKLRWRPPQPRGDWPGISDASSFGNVCIQINSDNQLVGSEDCLVLNIFIGQPPQSQNLPVMVFFHGGGNIQGDTHQARFDAPPLATQGVIVVTAEYRLGLLGYFSNALLTAEDGLSSGNYNLLDQIAALTWVKQNITAFGGDPTHVMAFGQSSGSADVEALLTSPLAQGLFATVGMETGGIGHGELLTLSEIEALDQPIVSTLGCDSAADVLACLRAVPASTIVSNQAPFANNDLMIEPRVLPVNPFDVLQQHGSSVPLLIGSNREEFATLGDDPNAPLDTNGYAAAVHTRFDPFGAGVADKVLALYPVTDYDSPAYALIAVDTDYWVTCGYRQITRAATVASGPPVWRYIYTHRFENDSFWNAFRAFHGAELFFIFGNLQALTGGYIPTPVEAALADQMIGYWTRFAATGDPNGAGASPWPQYDPTTDPMLQLDDAPTAINGYHTPQCDYFSTLQSPP
jgi:para-nitrobenzyl esterase